MGRNSNPAGISSNKSRSLMETLSIKMLLTERVCSIQFCVDLSRSVSGLLIKY